MKNSLATMRALLCLIAAMLLLVGCDEPDKAAAQPQTVRKKITAKAETGPPAAAAAEKPVLAQVAKPQTPPSIPAPPPGSKEPPPAPSAESPRPASPAPAAPLLPSPAATATASSPPTAAKPLAPDVNAQQSGMAAVDSQIAALLNIQAPPPYNPKGKVDPFAPLLQDESAAAGGKLRAKSDPDRQKTPLEKIDLGQLKLVAIITAPGGNRALVEESSGKGYIIKEGTYIGLSSGKVVGIKADKVFVEEEFEDMYGKSVTKKKEITLPKPPGEL